MKLLSTLLLILTLAAAALAVDPAVIKIEPATIAPGGTGAVTVTITNTSTAVVSQPVLSSVDVTYLDEGTPRTAHAECYVQVQRSGPGKAWTQLAYTPQASGLTIDWNSLSFAGGAVNPRLEWLGETPSIKADSLPGGASWVTTFSVRN